MCRVSAGAGKVYWPSGSSGMLYTPDYPIPYPAGTNCFWTITVPPGKRVKLTFEDFELEKNSVNTGYSYNCKYDQTDVQRDYVEIRDGPWSNSRELATYCGNKLDFEFYSTGHQMWIMFRSAADGLRESKGFKAHFVAVEPSKLHNKYHNCNENSMLLRISNPLVISGTVHVVVHVEKFHVNHRLLRVFKGLKLKEF